jgi:hypothetical protein
MDALRPLGDLPVVEPLRPFRLFGLGDLERGLFGDSQCGMPLLPGECGPFDLGDLARGLLERDLERRGERRGLLLEASSGLPGRFPSGCAARATEGA